MKRSCTATRSRASSPRAAIGHRIDRSIALGYVKSDFAREGMSFELDLLGQTRTATVSLQAPYDPQGSLLRS